MVEELKFKEDRTPLLMVEMDEDFNVHMQTALRPEDLIIICEEIINRAKKEQEGDLPGEEEKDEL